MRFFRFTLNDSNFRVEAKSLVWDLPLSLEHTMVGLNSFAVEMTEEFESLDDVPVFMTVKCNLLDRTMINQHGIMELIPIKFEDVCSYTTLPKNIGKIFN